MGRMVEMHPGSDVMVRVAMIRTTDSRLHRPISQICSPLRASESQADEDLETGPSRRATGGRLGARLRLRLTYETSGMFGFYRITRCVEAC